MRLNIEIKILIIIFRLTTFENIIKFNKNIEIALKFFQLYSTLIPNNILLKKNYLNFLSAIYSWNSNSKDQKKHKRKCYRCEKKDHEIKNYLYILISHKSLQIYSAYFINYINIGYESVLNNLENYDVKKLEYIENNNSNKNKYRKIFL